METEEINNLKAKINAARICEEIFDSITIYVHITSQDKVPNPYLHCDFDEPLSSVSFSNVPFTDPNWKDKLHHLNSNLNSNVTKNIGIEGEQIISYEIHRQLALDISYILTLKGHEVFICFSQNPSSKNGKYIHISKEIRDSLSGFKEEINKVKI